MIRPVILSGGSGTRLWPLSRQDWPKQLLPLTGELTLLQLTALRTADRSRFAAPVVVANQRHAQEIARQLTQVGLAPASIILEPMARNTAPAIALAALSVDPSELLLVMPSDHSIADSEAFREAVARAVPLAREGWLVTFGLSPTHPETGYGYIKQGRPLRDGVFEVDRFVEKPDLAVAEHYVSAGGYLWNGGIFLFTVAAFLDELGRNANAVLANVSRAVSASVADGIFSAPRAEDFASADSISVDYAVMEKAERIAVVPVDMGWSDVGSWDALHELSDPDGEGNRLLGEIILAESSNCSVRSTGPTIAMVGVRNLTVIATGDAVLIMPAGESHQIKHLLAQLHERQSKTLRGWPAGLGPGAETAEEWRPPPIGQAE